VWNFEGKDGRADTHTHRDIQGVEFRGADAHIHTHTHACIHREREREREREWNFEGTMDGHTITKK
jgi:hypothetical protein